MNMSSIWQKFRFLLVLGSLSVLVGCSSWEPMESSTTADDIPEGPGIFSGEKGEFVIYDQEEEK